MDMDVLAIVGAPPMGALLAIRFELLERGDADAELDHMHHG
jgi:hypothetical protein